MSFRHFAPAIALLALVATATTAPAQYAPPQHYYGGYDNSASTPAGSYARGMSDLIRSQGAKNLRDAQAAEEVEEARAKYMENRMQATENYFRMRSMNRAYREDERGPRPTSEELFRLAKLKAPDRLSPSEMDPISGEVNWPMVLRDEMFAPTRIKLDKMFAYWAEHGNQLSIDQYAEMQRSLEQLSAMLVTVVESTPPKPYAEARNFLESIGYELQIAQGY
jgi:hypothetical protein